MSKDIQSFPSPSPLPSVTGAPLRRNTSQSLVNKAEIFTSQAIWEATNLNTKIEFELSGVNVGLYLSESEPLRKLLLSGDINGFTRDNLYIRFKKLEAPRARPSKKKAKCAAKKSALEKNKAPQGS